MYADKVYSIHKCTVGAIENERHLTLFTWQWKMYVWANEIGGTYPFYVHIFYVPPHHSTQPNIRIYVHIYVVLIICEMRLKNDSTNISGSRRQSTEPPDSKCMQQIIPCTEYEYWALTLPPQCCTQSHTLLLIAANQRMRFFSKRPINILAEIKWNVRRVNSMLWK